MNQRSLASPHLVEHAQRLGILPSFEGGGVMHFASDATLEAVIAARTAGSSEPEVLPGAGRAVPPSIVYRAGGGYILYELAPLRSATVECEDGSQHTLPVTDGATQLEIPGGLPLGYHTLELHYQQGNPQRVFLIATPDRAPQPQPSIGKQHCAGIQVQLYQVVSRRSWGLGDFADLRLLAVTAATELGAGFIVVNPLNATAPVTPLESSPYLPTTREFLSPLYIAPEEAPGADDLTSAERAEFDAAASRARASSAADRIDRDTVWTAKLAALRLCFTAVCSQSPKLLNRATSVEASSSLRRFATWCALAEQHGPSWRSWPAELHDPQSPAVADFVASHAVEVSFHMWLQEVAESQLAAAHAAAKDAGMPLGIVTDLPVGIHPEGSDTWSIGQDLATGVTVGAPPDMFNQQGQDWSQPPLRPDVLARTGYAAFARLIRAAVRHAGGVRIDHILGLGRLWWIPAGMSATEGAYVTYDLQAMLGVLSLEAHRAGAVVVGEDLGMVDPNIRTALADWGVLGTSIVWFEHDWSATNDSTPVAYLHPSQYRDGALTTVTTHDLPPTAGYLNGEHVRVRAELGVLSTSVEEELGHATDDIAAMVEALYRNGMIGSDLSGRVRAHTDPAADIFTAEETTELVVGLHAYCAGAPSVLVAASLVDLVGDRRAINVPGTALEYPNWQLPLTNAHGERVFLEQCLTTELARRVFAPLTQ